jgi:hypothetical protein
VDTTIVQQLGQLGLSVSMRELEAAVAEVFPTGTKEVAHESVVRSLFLHFRRKNTADMAER